MRNLALVSMLVLGVGLAQKACGQQAMLGAAPLSSDAAPPQSATQPTVSIQSLADPSRKYFVVQSPGGVPVIVGGTDHALARNDLLGLWRVVHLEQNGTANPALAGQLHLRFHRGKIELMQCGRVTREVAYNINVSYYPRHFDWFVKPGGSICMQRGVYWLTEDRLLLCLGSINERRASEFLTQPGDGRTLFVLERAEPEN